LPAALKVSGELFGVAVPERENRPTAERAFDDGPFRVDVAKRVSRHRPLSQSFSAGRPQRACGQYGTDKTMAKWHSWPCRRQELGGRPRVAVRNPQGVMDQKKSIGGLLSDIRTANAPDSALPPQGKSFEHLSDQSVLQLYEGIRHQVEADRAMGNRYRLVGNATKERAQRLQAELVQRDLKFMPIIWP
jgi:hypothetical protein